MKNFTEFCKEQADKLFEIIDQHQGLLQWQKTWHVEGNSSLPKGGRGFYQGINLWKLFIAQITEGYGSSIWLTYNQIKQQGGCVLKGAKGKQVCFFKLKEAEIEGVDEIEQEKMIPLFRVYTVFNMDQTNLAGEEHDKTSLTSGKLQQLLAVLGVNISEFGNQPHFQPTRDVIVMPRRDFFNSSDDYDVTLLHELIHWTGHPSRLDRETLKEYDKGNNIRAEEELVAEIGSVFLIRYFGISGDLINHASYVSSWKKYLDAKSVARALSNASKAFIWLVGYIERVEAA